MEGAEPLPTASESLNTKSAEMPAAPTRTNEEEVMTRMLMMWMFGVPLSVMLLFMAFGII